VSQGENFTLFMMNIPKGSGMTVSDYLDLIVKHWEVAAGTGYILCLIVLRSATSSANIAMLLCKSTYWAIGFPILIPFHLARLTLRLLGPSSNNIQNTGQAEERPYVSIDNPQVVVSSMKRSGSKWILTLRTHSSMSTTPLTISGKAHKGGNGSVNGESFRYTVDWGD